VAERLLRYARQAFSRTPVAKRSSGLPQHRSASGTTTS